MKNFKTYVQEANCLCNKILRERDAAIARIKINQMQESVSRSELTVYQKERLLRQLNSTSEVSHV